MDEKKLNTVYLIYISNRAWLVGHGLLSVTLRPHDRETERQVRRKHARERSRWPGNDAALHSGKNSYLLLKPLLQFLLEIWNQFGWE